MGEALAAAARGVAQHPVAGASIAFQFGERLLTIGSAAASRLAGDAAEGPMPADPRDKRFTDPAWENNPAYWALRQAYLATRQYGLDMLRLGDLDAVSEGKAELAMGFLADAFAPTNFPLTNPAVLKKALDTGGRSFVEGWRNFVDDMLHNKGRPRQVDSSALRGRAQPRLHTVQSGLPQRPHRGAAVRTADRPGARGAPAVQSAMDQQVLRDGSGTGAQLHRVGGPAQPHGVRDQLPQPGRVDGEHHDGRLSRQRTHRRDGRHPRDHRRREGRPRRALPRRGAVDDDGDLPRRDRRRPRQHRHAAQHDGRLRRSRARSECSPTRRPSRSWNARWPSVVTSRPTRWRARSTCCAPTTSSSTTSSRTG